MDQTHGMVRCAMQPNLKPLRLPKISRYQKSIEVTPDKTDITPKRRTLAYMLLFSRWWLVDMTPGLDWTQSTSIEGGGAIRRIAHMLQIHVLHFTFTEVLLDKVLLNSSIKSH